MEETKQVEQAPPNDEALVRQKREALKAENDALEAEFNRAQVLRAQQLTGGRSYGLPAPVIDEATKKKNDAIDFWKGTGIDTAIQKHG